MVPHSVAMLAIMHRETNLQYQHAECTTIYMSAWAFIKSNTSHNIPELLQRKFPKSRVANLNHSSTSAHFWSTRNMHFWNERWVSTDENLAWANCDIAVNPWKNLKSHTLKNSPRFLVKTILIIASSSGGLSVEIKWLDRLSYAVTFQSSSSHPMIAPSSTQHKFAWALELHLRVSIGNHSIARRKLTQEVQGLNMWIVEWHACIPCMVSRGECWRSLAVADPSIVVNAVKLLAPLFPNNAGCTFCSSSSSQLILVMLMSTWLRLLYQTSTIG